MITKEKFIKLINNHLDWLKRIDDVQDFLEIDLLDTPWISYADFIFNDALELCFDEEGCDHIVWWVYEKQYNPELTVKDANDNVVPSETVDDLWELVKNNVL